MKNCSVLDEKLQPVPAREIGDLYISGVGLSPGYWRDPQKTAAAFIHDPHSPDFQSSDPRTACTVPAILRGKTNRDSSTLWVAPTLKSKSADIASSSARSRPRLNSMGKLQECAVVAIPTDNFGGWMICCAYVVRSGEEVSLIAIREHLKKTVPSYMFPARWMAYDVLPKNPNGKIDRPRLKDRFTQGKLRPRRRNLPNTNGVITLGGTAAADDIFSAPQSARFTVIIICEY